MHEIIVVSTPSLSGGGLRALKALKSYSKIFRTRLFLAPSWENLMLPNVKTLFIDNLGKLATDGVYVVGYAIMQRLPFDAALNKGLHLKLKGFRQLLPPIMKFIVQKDKLSPNLVMTLHEDCDALYTAYKLAETFNVKSLALLQLPPFYGSKTRKRKIYAAYKLWLDIQFQNNSLKKYLTFSYNVLLDNVTNYRRKELLNKFSRIVAVSKAIPMEMGYEWENKVTSMDPGVSLDDEDIMQINLLKGRWMKKKNHIVFGGRPLAVKGLIEGLMAFRRMVKSYTNLKMIITGNISTAALANIGRFCQNIGIKDKVFFTGFLPRVDRFKIVSESKLMLYPSHVDAFPYAVCESLYLGTPVIAYRIPALEIYYGGLNSVKLVEEGDFEALAEEAINVLANKVSVEAPKIKSWDEIMHEETEIITKTLSS